MTLQEQLVQIWSLSKFGVKTRVFDEYPQQNISYILSNPNYGDKQMIKDIIDCVKKHAEIVENEITQMNSSINKISA